MINAGELKDTASATRYCAKQSQLLQHDTPDKWRTTLNAMIAEINKIPKQGTIFTQTIELFKQIAYVASQTFDIESAVYKAQMGSNYVMKSTLDNLIAQRDKAQNLATELLKNTQKKPGLGQKFKGLFAKENTQLLAINKTLLTFADAVFDVLSRKINAVKKAWEQENI
jgi:hypothetical protein